MSDCSQVIFSLLEYERWCNIRALDFLDGITDEQCKRDFGFGLRTPQRTMFHIAEVMRGWGVCVGPAIEKPSWLSYNDRVSLREIRGILTDAADHLIEGAIASNAAGVLAEHRRLNQAFHLVTHGTHHRGQLLSMITLMGYGQPFEGGDFGGWSNSAVS